MKLKKILATILVFTILICTLPFNMVIVSAATTVGEAIDDYVVPILGKNMGGSSYTYYKNGSAKAWQCHAFVNEVWYNVFGYDIYDSACYRTSSSSDFNSLSSYVRNNARVGDILRFDNTSNSTSYMHSLLLREITSTGITVYEYGGARHYYADGPVKETYSWSQLQTRWNGGSSCYYYLYKLYDYAYSPNSSGTVNVVNYESKNTIEQTNAILWGQVNKPSSYDVTQIGIKVRKSDSTYDNGWSKYEAPSWDYVGETFVQPYYNLNTELSLTLSPGTDYYYKIYAKVNGTEYWSTETKFTTTGSHSHSYPSSWTTVTAATCTASGSAKRVCTSCGNTETKTLTVLGHNYSSSYTIDKAATCTTAGSKSRHCTRCSSTTDVTTIAATGHSYYSGYEAAHPHKYYQKCNCGYYYYTGETATVDSCSICNALEKPIITIAKEEYHILSDIEISWTKIDRATHYKLCILQKESDKDNSTPVLEEDYITNNSYIVQNLFEELPIGEYCVYIYAYDNQNYNDKLNDWNNQKSDPVYFKIYTTANYYDWNFDYDTFKDSYIKGSDTSYAEKNVINSKKVYNTDELLTNIDYERIGYKFTGWNVQFSPFETFGDITTLIYGIQAQYEQLSYSKGECLYGDTNFDEKINVLDLIHLKRILIGTEENHICADLDADDKINAIDILMLKRFLLGSKVSRNIYFDANGGTVDETQRLVVSGQTLGELPIPSRTGYDFTGWYTSDGTSITSDTVMTKDSDISAIAKWTAKSYTYNIVYKSSNGTSLGTATAKNNFGTTNTISPKSFTGYNTPSSQSIKWDSTSTKTITFTYTPISVSTSQNIANGIWMTGGHMTFSVNAEYRNRTASSVEVRLVWTNTLKANYKYGYTQGFKATIGGVSTGIVTIASSSLWSSSATYDRTATAYSEWKTISLGTSRSSISISAIPGRVLASGDIDDIDESFTSSITIPAY